MDVVISAGYALDVARSFCRSDAVLGAPLACAVTTPGISGQLTAIPLSGGGSNIVVNSFARRVGQQQAANTLTIPASAAKQLQGKVGVMRQSNSSSVTVIVL